MCCCNVRCLQYCLYISCVLLLGTGAVIIWIGFEVQDSEFVKTIDAEYAGYGIIGLGGGMIVFAVVGFISGCKRSKCLLFIFIFISFIIGVLLVAFGAVIIYVRDNFLPKYLDSESDCRDFDAFEEADDGFGKAFSTICTVYCPCGMDSDIYAEVKDLLYPNQTQHIQGTTDILSCDPCSEAATYPSAVQDVVYQWIRDNLDLPVTSSADCIIPEGTYEDVYLKDYKKYIPLIKWMEKHFDCSGLCSYRPIYLFSDINNGVPENSCRKEVYDWAKDKFLTYGVITIVFGCWQLYTFLLAAGLCCNCTNSRHKGKK
ncbi:unnamed protein product [Blepharisma stoltei]|uniref:Tetraspanin n=1 Tax=Blepharisma stoltei TaxID=1481888 RepID=A0AAU9J189_9CILI|nr:unnamed protein product [Blepharisma stoltei]